jgi:hypothetical protein
MVPCGDCGQSLADGARFCPNCGAAAAAVPTLLGLEAVRSQAAHSESTVTSGSLGRNRMLVAVGTVLVGALALSMIGSGSQGLAERASAVDGADRVTVPSTLSPAPSSAATTSLVAPVDGRPGDPLLGRPVGLSLLIGGSSNLRRLDLDTGVVTDYDTNGWPIYADGGRLVLAEPDGGRVRAVGLDQLAARERDWLPLGISSSWPPVSTGPEPGTIWLLASIGQPTWQLIHITDGSTVDEITVTSDALHFTSGGPMIATSAAGGVFAHDGTTYRRVFDGVPLAVSDEFVLARSCSLPTACSLHWLRRDTWEEIDRAVPTDPVWWVGWLSADGRVLAYSGAERTRFFDVERGEPLDPATDVDPTRVVASAGTQFLVVAQSRLGVYDLGTGATHRIELNARADDRFLFVPND